MLLIYPSSFAPSTVNEREIFQVLANRSPGCDEWPEDGKAWLPNLVAHLLIDIFKVLWNSDKATPEIWSHTKQSLHALNKEGMFRRTRMIFEWIGAYLHLITHVGSQK